MGLGKQARVLSKAQVKSVRGYLADRRNGLRNETIFLLSFKAGLRAKEIASLTWAMVLGSDGEVSNVIALTNQASKGKSGRIIPLASDLREVLVKMLEVARGNESFSGGDRVIQSERSKAVESQTIINLFRTWFSDLGLEGCSSHSGRRTFITNTARLVSTVGGSLRDVQMMAGHASLQMTQSYIESDSEAQRKVVGLL